MLPWRPYSTPMCEVLPDYLWNLTPEWDYEMMTGSNHQPKKSGRHVHSSSPTWNSRWLCPSTSDHFMLDEHSSESWDKPPSMIVHAPTWVITSLQGSAHESARSWPEWTPKRPLSRVPDTWPFPGRVPFDLAERGIPFSSNETIPSCF